MRCLVDVEPLPGRDLVRADHRADLVVEDLCRGARQRREPFVAQPRQVLVETGAERSRALPDLQRAERMHMQVRYGVLDRLHDGRVVVTGEARVDPALKADLGRAAVPRLDGTPDDLRMRDQVRPPTQVRGQPALREGTEAAAEVADVRVLDVA